MKNSIDIVAFIKANEVAGGGTGSGEWGAELVAMDGRYTGDERDALFVAPGAPRSLFAGLRYRFNYDYCKGCGICASAPKHRAWIAGPRW